LGKGRNDSPDLADQGLAAERTYGGGQNGLALGFVETTLRQAGGKLGHQFVMAQKFATGGIVRTWRTNLLG